MIQVYSQFGLGPQVKGRNFFWFPTLKFITSLVLHPVMRDFKVSLSTVVVALLVTISQIGSNIMDAQFGFRVSWYSVVKMSPKVVPFTWPYRYHSKDHGSCHI